MVTFHQKLLPAHDIPGKNIRIAKSHHIRGHRHLSNGPDFLDDKHSLLYLVCLDHYSNL
jgi:hypothetical protein